MKKYKPYVVYIEKDDQTIKLYVPAMSAKDARKYVEGSGEIVALKEAPGTMPSAEKVDEAMRKDGCSKAECQLIMYLMAQTVCDVRGEDNE